MEEEQFETINEVVLGKNGPSVALGSLGRGGGGVCFGVSHGFSDPKAVASLGVGSREAFTCKKQQNLKTYNPKHRLSKSANTQETSKNSKHLKT